MALYYMKARMTEHSFSHGAKLEQKLDWLFLFVFALTLVSFAAVGTRYLSVVFDHTTRFLMLLVLSSLVLWRGYIWRGSYGAFGLWASFYLAWVCATVFWSQVPVLSASKAILQVVVTVTCVFAGYAWTRKVSLEHAFDVFAGMTLLAILVGVFGAIVTATTVDTGSMILYRGLAYNPNSLGIIVIMSIPWTVGFFQLNFRGHLQRRFLAYAMLASMLVVLMLTSARSSILAVGIIGIVYLYYVGFGKYAAVILIIFFIGSIANIAMPDLSDKLWELLAKKTSEHDDIFYSRRQVWADSWDGAEQGDLFGLGFGVSAGFTEFSGGFSAAVYGREKGNSVLAILEELGQLGLVLYILMIISFLARLIGAAARVPSRLLRAQLGLVIGTTLGLIANSQFEAWFVAPSAPASPFFWSLAGCGLALSYKAEQMARARKAALDKEFA